MRRRRRNGIAWARTGATAALALALGLDAAARLLGPTEVAAQVPARAERRDATVRAVERAGPAITNIATERVVERTSPLFDQFFREFGGREREQRSVARSLGSGIIIDPAGYAITNAHVVQRASRIVLTFPDDREFEARLLSLSNTHDLALVKIDAPQPLPFVRLGTSADLMPGESVIAVGNPFGLENTVTRGVVSARDRKIKKDGRDLEGTFLQTDAAINPGNSGGALLNLEAELVGVNTAVHAGGQGIGFAIPVDRVRTVLGELSNPEVLRDGWLGWKLEASPAGARVARVEAGSPAAQAGVEVGDLVETVGGVRVSSVFEAQKPFLDSEAALPVILKTASGGRRAVSLALVASPSRTAIERRLGIQGRDLTPALAWKKGFDVESGVLVLGVTAGGPAARIGVEAGDVLTKVARRVTNPRSGQTVLEVAPVAGAAPLARALEKLGKGDDVVVFVVRKGRELQGELRLD